MLFVIIIDYNFYYLILSNIVPQCEYNVSDHLPLRMCMYIDVHNYAPVNQLPEAGNQIFTNWNRAINNTKYKYALEKSLAIIPKLDLDEVKDDPMSICAR